MDPRTPTRLSTILIPTQITGLRNLQLQTSGRILGVSSRGLSVGTSEPVAVGSFLRLDLEDSAILGEVRYCEAQRSWYEIGLFVEEMLIGSSDLARLLASLIESTTIVEGEAIRSEEPLPSM
jgi:hypothetical protein